MRKLYTKVFVALLVCVALTVSAVPACAASGFVDVAEDSPWHESVTYLAEQGITNGVGNQRYAPDEQITISQWAIMLCRAFNQEDETSLLRAYQNGWLSTCAVLEPDFGGLPWGTVSKCF